MNDKIFYRLECGSKPPLSLDDYHFAKSLFEDAAAPTKLYRCLGETSCLIAERFPDGNTWFTPEMTL